MRVEDFIVTALIDMYSKFGGLDYAEKVFYSIKDPSFATWRNSIISGYRDLSIKLSFVIQNCKNKG